MAMQLNEVQLQELEEFASLLMSPDDIATILQISAESLRKEIKSKEGPIYTAFVRGKLITEAALRKTTINFAKQGSTPALTAALKLRDEQNIKLLNK